MQNISTTAQAQGIRTTCTASMVIYNRCLATTAAPEVMSCIRKWYKVKSYLLFISRYGIRNQQQGTYQQYSLLYLNSASCIWTSDGFWPVTQGNIKDTIFWQTFMIRRWMSEDQHAESENQALMGKFYLPFIFACISSSTFWSWFICLTMGRSIQIK